MGLRPLDAVALLALVAALAVTFAAPSATRQHAWPWTLVTALVWLTPIVVFAVRCARRDFSALPDRYVLVGLGLLGVSAAASALLSPFTAATLPQLWPIFGGAAWFLVFHHWAQSDLVRTRLLVVLPVFAAGFALLSFWQWWGGQWPLPWTARNAYPFGHSTYTAGAVVLLFPWLAVRVALSRSLIRAVWFAAALVALGTLVSTGSRGGVLALAALAVAVSGVLLFSSRRPLRHKLLLVAAGAALVAALIATNSRLRELVVHGAWSDIARESNLQRRAMLEAGIQLGADRWLLGWGPGSVPLAYPRVRALLSGGPENVLQLHNTPVQLWATLGLAGAVASALLIFGIVRAAARAPRTPECLAAAASLFSYTVVAFTDHQIDLPFFALLVALNAAVLTSSARRTLASEARPSLVGLLVPAVALPAIALPATARDLLARHAYDRALSFLERNQPAAHLAALDRAATFAPHDPFYLHQSAAHLLNQRPASADPAHQRALTRAAVERLRQSLAAGTHQELAHFNLGWLLLDLDESAAAARHFESAARLVPDKGGVYFGLGLARLQRGQHSAAIRAFALEWINDPRSVTSPAWETPQLAALAAPVRAECQRLFHDLLPHLPSSLHPAADAARWWTTRESASPLLRAPVGFNAASTRFFAHLGAAVPPPASATQDPWAGLWRAWQTPAPAAFLPLARGDHAYADALARRARAHPDDFRAFLTAPVGEERALLLTYRRQRVGYGVLALHPEGPQFVDTFVVQENRVTADFAAALFPPKGWLPGRLLLALLPSSSP